MLAVPLLSVRSGHWQGLGAEPLLLAGHRRVTDPSERSVQEFPMPIQGSVPREELNIYLLYTNF